MNCCENYATTTSQKAKKRRKYKKRHRKKMRRRLAKRVYPLPASHFRCRFVLRENILLNCNILNCKFLLFLIKKFFVLSVFACVCLSFGGAKRHRLVYGKHTSKCQYLLQLLYIKKFKLAVFNFILSPINNKISITADCFIKSRHS